MAGKIKQLVSGVCAALLMLGAFVGAAAGCVNSGESIQAADGAAMLFYDDITIAHHRITPSDHQICEDDGGDLAYKKHMSVYARKVLQPEQNTENIQEVGIKESNYTFSLNGNGELLWNYEDTRENSDVGMDWINDVDGDGVSDIVTSDCWNGSGKLLLLSSRTGAAIWGRDFGVAVEIAGDIGDINGDGAQDIVIYSNIYNETSNETMLTIYLVSGIDGNTIWCKSSMIKGDWNVQGTSHKNDFNGDGVNDALFRFRGSSWEYGLWQLDAISGGDGSVIWHVSMNESFGGCVPRELPDLNGDGVGDYVASSQSYNTNAGNVTALNGKDGSVIWSRSINGYSLCTFTYFDFNKDEIVDIVVEGDDWNNDTGCIFMLDGRDGSTIWDKYYNMSVGVDCWLYDDIDNDGIYDLVVSSETVEMLSGATGDVIWAVDYAVSDAGTCKDIDGDGKNDVLAVTYTQIDSHNYQYNVTALSGTNGNKIWGAGFAHHVEVIPPEGVWNNTYCWAFSHGWGDQNGDGVPDPYLDIDYHCSYWNESASEQVEYSALKFVMMDGANGGEMWDAEITSTGWNGIHWTCSGYDFEGDGVDDMFFSTQSGMYAVKTTGAGSANRPPIASFTHTIETPPSYDAVTFNASTSCDPDGTIVSYGWDFGDENTTTTPDPVIRHSYTTEDNYNVILTVTDDDGAKHSVSRVVTVATLRGDMNRDGAVTSTDAAIALDIAARGGWNADADLNDDGRITSLDALMILSAAEV